MADFQGGGLSDRRSIFSNYQFWLSWYLLKKHPRLGTQLHNAVDENQSCHILPVNFNQIDQQQIPEYIIYSSTLLYKCIYFYIGLRV